MPDTNESFFTNAFTIDLACALATKCGINECPMDFASCPFGHDGNDGKVCAHIAPSMWVKVLKERVG